MGAVAHALGALLQGTPLELAKPVLLPCRNIQSLWAVFSCLPQDEHPLRDQVVLPLVSASLALGSMADVMVMAMYAHPARRGKGEQLVRGRLKLPPHHLQWLKRTMLVASGEYLEVREVVRV